MFLDHSLCCIKAYHWRITIWALTSSSCGLKLESLMKVDVISGTDFHTSYAVFLPFLLNDDTVSHPVKAWNISNALDVSGPRQFAISCTATQNSFNNDSWNISEIGSKSVSTVRICIFVNPRLTASAMCTIILVSASSWVHG